jgi:hypothetical protein
MDFGRSGVPQGPNMAIVMIFETVYQLARQAASLRAQRLLKTMIRNRFPRT